MSCLTAPLPYNGPWPFSLLMTVQQKLDNGITGNVKVMSSACSIGEGTAYEAYNNWGTLSNVVVFVEPYKSTGMW